MEKLSKIIELLPPDLLPKLADLIRVVISSFLTFLVTKYTLLKPNKQKIVEQQFNKVYLPLYRLTQQYLTPDSIPANFPIYFKKIEKLINNNYPLVYPKTIKLFNLLKSSCTDSKYNPYHLTNFESQITTDYEKMKRVLGYPTDSFWDFFKRLNPLNKFLYSIITILSVAALYFLVATVSALFSSDMLQIIENFFGLGLSGSIVYIFVYIARH